MRVPHVCPIRSLRSLLPDYASCMSCIKSPKAVSPKVFTSVSLTPKTVAGLVAWAQFVGLSPERLASELVAEQLNAFKRRNGEGAERALSWLRWREKLGLRELQPLRRTLTAYIMPDVNALICSCSKQLGISQSEYIESLVVREFSEPEEKSF